MITIPETDLVVHELCLGSNIFGSNADKSQSHAVMDAYFSHGGNLGDDHLIVTASPTTSTLKILGLTTLTTVGAAWELGIKLNNKAARVAEIAMFLYRTVIFYFSKIDSSQTNIFQTHI